MSGLNIVIVAPSGTGKSTLIKKVFEKFPQLSWSVSCTTRPKRDGEVHGVDYYYLDKTDFEKRIENEEFIEWAKVHSNYYGTSKKFVNDGLKEGKKLLFDLDVQGADQMKKHFGSLAQIIFIEPPSVEALEQRLINRGTDKIEVIKERVENAKKELLRKNDYDFLVRNEHFETALGELYRIFTKLLNNEISA